MRKFDSGATRDTDENKVDFEGYLNPLVLQRFGHYMLKHQLQADGQLRASDNWQKGMTKEVYIKSGLRHVHDWWMEHRGYTSREGLQDALCGVLFNVMGYLLEDLREGGSTQLPHEQEQKIEAKFDARYDQKIYVAESESDKAYYPPTHMV